MHSMPTLAYILIFTFLGSIVALIGGIILLSRKKFALKISHFLASFAAGVLLGSAFFDLLPEATHEAEGLNIDVHLWVLIGIILFFLIERSIHWFHHHTDYYENADKEPTSTVPLIVIGDTVHNFIDGVVIAATFLTNIPLGVVTALAVFIHEIPQEMGDFGLMLHRGLPRRKIILVNLLSASVAFAGAIITYLLGNVLENYIPILLALTAGFFIYIATSDLIPEIHHEKRRGFAIIESILLVIGVTVIWLSVSFLEHG